MDIFKRDEMILKAISKTSIYPFSHVEKIFEMSFSYDLTLMALDLSISQNISPEDIVNACFPKRQEKPRSPKPKFMEEWDKEIEALSERDMLNPRQMIARLVFLIDKHLECK